MHCHRNSNSGLITLAADPTLCLDIQGNAPGNGVGLVVATFVLGRPYQRWNWVGSPPYIMNNGALGLCVDNANGNMSPGNKIQLWQLENGDTNQQWTELAAIMLKNLAA